ncbi:hypothetical protein RFI_30721 [Reticulomyxa filosa]|uniref:Uncharacterized protein n=1 Tax=Reticulomyxa filosa TaxID=46433 RepID=X6LZ80_RETFI|nr:hypothetical protein RFI_30721 [Reticulomyxa filosa]|eukprot:ETO06676.1 hypothetical protein RFI_30721 [Reticulomyxa filosa]
MQSSLVCCLYDKDNFALQYLNLSSLCSTKLKKNTNGFHLIGFCQPTKTILPGQWTLKFVSNTSCLNADAINMKYCKRYPLNYSPNDNRLLLQFCIVYSIEISKKIGSIVNSFFFFFSLPFLYRDEIQNCNYLFIQFVIKMQDGNPCGALVSLTNRDSKDSEKTYHSIQGVVTVPCYCAQNSTAGIKVECVDYINQKITKIGAFSSVLHVISDVPFRLLPDRLQTQKFLSIQQNWFKEKNRKAKAIETRKKYLGKTEEEKKLITRPPIPITKNKPVSAEELPQYWKKEQETKATEQLNAKENFQRSKEAQEKKSDVVEKHMECIVNNIDLQSTKVNPYFKSYKVLLNDKHYDEKPNLLLLFYISRSVSTLKKFLMKEVSYLQLEPN